MAHQCDLYFFVKISWRKKRAFHILRTVIWNLGRKEGVGAATAVAKRVELGVTQSLSLTGFFGWLLEVEVHHVLLPCIGVDEAKALLKDPTFTFPEGALALSLHCASVALTDNEEKNPFCTVTP